MTQSERLTRFLLKGEEYQNKHGMKFTYKSMVELAREGMEIAKRWRFLEFGLEVCNAIILFVNHYNDIYDKKTFLKRLIYQEVKKKHPKKSVPDIVYVGNNFDEYSTESVEIISLDHDIKGKDKKFLDLFLQGYSPQEIQHTYNVSKTTYYRMLDNLVKKLKEGV